LRKIKKLLRLTEVDREINSGIEIQNMGETQGTEFQNLKERYLRDTYIVYLFSFRKHAPPN